ncbi:hypothetical protein ILUMI_04352 [Ignelater luminosus]|uniref:Uncharacterized protein n=1 Tax=Ignelater luminosus TaxID=2038154 RepID=A0A8K0DCR9_IGNLU|nr:hypothetical protein ILUMI_04352 [Ignelater luminosus]
MLKEITGSTRRATRYKEAYNKSLQKKRRQYEVIRHGNKNFYPSYSTLQKAKKECYPPKEALRVIETCTEVRVQHLLDYSVSRLFTYLEEVLETLNEHEFNTLELRSKWGCHGSQQAQSFESVLHLSYKLPVKKWQLRSKNDKSVVKERKAKIQLKFRQETGLLVDVPKAGVDSTNDGNTNRRFFANPQIAAEKTEIDFNFIYRLKVILEFTKAVPARRELFNLDIMNRLLLNSEPLVSSLRPIPKKKTAPFMKETLDMLIPVDPEADSIHSDDDFEDRKDDNEESSS